MNKKNSIIYIGREHLHPHPDNPRIVREPYQIGNHDDPLLLVVVWYGRHMGDAKLRDIQPTGKKYPEIVKIMEELKG